MLATSVVTCALLATATATGCSGKVDTLEFSRGQEQATSIGTSMSACPALAANVTLPDNSGHPIITKLCYLDDEGHYFDSMLSDTAGPLPILPGGHRYSIVYEFADGWVPSQTNAAAGAHVYMAPRVVISPCAQALPEDDPANLVAAQVTVQNNTLTQDIPNVLPDGEQLVSFLDLSALYGCSGRCTEPSADGFVVRTYIANVPSCGN
jgi:hypothetical protein